MGRLRTPRPDRRRERRPRKRIVYYAGTGPERHQISRREYNYRQFVGLPVSIGLVAVGTVGALAGVQAITNAAAS